MSAKTATAIPASEDLLRLERQLCFPLYATSRLLTRVYQPFLEPLGLTYPQYIVLMILWEDAPCAVTRIGQRAVLNTNTLTPLLKRLEQLGYVRRQRRATDERIVEISLTDAGIELKSRCSSVPMEVFRQMTFPVDKMIELKHLLDAFLVSLRESPATAGDDLDRPIP